MHSRDTRGILLPRRRFVQGLALGGAAAMLGLRPGRLSAQGSATPQVLGGTSFDLAIGELPVDFTGHRRVATVVNGQLPGPLLRWRQGDTITCACATRCR